MVYIEMILNRIIVRTLTQELYRIYTFLMPTTFIWNNQCFSPEELVDLQEVPFHVSGVQKVVKFWLSDAEFLPISTSGRTGMPKVWHHDIYKKDKSPFSKEEITFLKTILKNSPTNED